MNGEFLIKKKRKYVIRRHLEETFNTLKLYCRGRVKGRDKESCKHNFTLIFTNTRRLDNKLHSQPATSVSQW